MMLLFDTFHPEYSDISSVDMKSTLLARYLTANFDEVFWACAVRVIDHPVLLLDEEIHRIMQVALHQIEEGPDNLRIYLTHILGTLSLQEDLIQLCSDLDVSAEEIIEHFSTLFNESHLDIDTIFTEIRRYFES